MRDGWGGQLWLDDAHRVELIPDLAVCSAGVWQFVGDVKYKALRSDGARRDHVYQMLAYPTATGLQDGTLVYVGVDGPDETFRLPHLDQTIQILSVDLSKEDPLRELRQKVIRGAAMRYLRAQFSLSAETI